MSEVTHILEAIERGEQKASEQLLPLVYDELRRLAAARLSQEMPGHTLEPTALVHEAYLRLLGPTVPAPDDPRTWDGRGHFFAAAAEAMRRILVESARRKGRLKHGGKFMQRELRDDDLVRLPAEDDLLALDEALSRLAIVHPDLAKLVQLRYFAGLSVEQAAEAIGVSARTAKRNWVYARAWLRREMERGEV